jgi:hypothetical protein
MTGAGVKSLQHRACPPALFKTFEKSGQKRQMGKKLWV